MDRTFLLPAIDPITRQIRPRAFREWGAGPMLKEGDQFTLPNQYRRRTAWQWLTRCPRELQVFRIVASSDGCASPPFLEYRPLI